MELLLLRTALRLVVQSRRLVISSKADPMSVFALVQLLPSFELPRLSLPRLAHEAPSLSKNKQMRSIPLASWRGIKVE